MPFRILIADDHRAVRTVLRALIESHKDWQVCGEAVNGFEAVAKAGELKPDLVILDLAMPIMDGVRAAREISNSAPTLPILMHTMYDGSSTLVLEAKKAGVARVVSKGEKGENLLIAIEDLLNVSQSGTVPDTNIGILDKAAESPPSTTEKLNDLSISSPDSKDGLKPN